MRTLAIHAAVLVAAAISPILESAPGDIQLITARTPSNTPSISSPGSTYNGVSSADGRYIAFTSADSAFAPADNNDQDDIFVYDRVNSTIEPISVNASGAQGNGRSIVPAISADGRYVAFISSATNLTNQPDTNNADDVFVRDRQTGTIARISTTASGAQISGAKSDVSFGANSRFVAFVAQSTGGDPSPAPGLRRNTFLHDLVTHATQRVNFAVPNPNFETRDVMKPALSLDGRYLAFKLVQIAPNTSGKRVAFEQTHLLDRQTGAVTRVDAPVMPISRDVYVDAPSISADGRFVAYETHYPNTATGASQSTLGAFVRDLQTGNLQLISQWETSRIALNADGSQVLIDTAQQLVPEDENYDFDTYQINRQTLAPTLISKSLSGGASEYHSYAQALSADGRYALFSTSSNNIVANDNNASNNIFIRDNVSQTTTLVGELNYKSVSGNYVSYLRHFRAVSDTGRFVVFTSQATDLVANDPDSDYQVFIRDRKNQTTSIVSVSSSGVKGNGWSDNPSISQDGRFVVFTSPATNLAPVTGPLYFQRVYVHDRQTKQTTLVSAASQDSADGVISLNGRYIAYRYAEGAYVYDRQVGSTQLVSLVPNNVMTVRTVCDISGDGRYVLYLSDTRFDPSDSDRTNDLFVHDRAQQTTQYVGNINSEIGEQTRCGSISADGRYIAFLSSAKDLVPNDTNDYEDVFVVDQQTGATTRASVDSSGVQADSSSYSVFLSADGRYVLFDSSGRSLSPGGVAGASREVYLRDLQSGTTTLVSQAKNGARASDRTYANTGSISPDSRVIVFSSTSAIFVPGDRNDMMDIFSLER